MRSAHESRQDVARQNLELIFFSLWLRENQAEESFETTRRDQWTGENTSFACHVKLRSGNKVSLEKYLDLTRYRKNGSSYVKISDSETRRYNESCSLLMIKNAKVTPVNRVYYHCEIFYRGNKLKNSKTYDVGLVVQGKLVLFYVGYPVIYPSYPVVSHGKTVKVIN